jgi:hypothetical protein
MLVIIYFEVQELLLRILYACYSAMTLGVETWMLGGCEGRGE